MYCSSTLQWCRKYEALATLVVNKLRGTLKMGNRKSVYCGSTCQLCSGHGALATLDVNKLRGTKVNNKTSNVALSASWWLSGMQPPCLHLAAALPIDPGLESDSHASGLKGVQQLASGMHGTTRPWPGLKMTRHSHPRFASSPRWRRSRRPALASADQLHRITPLPQRMSPVMHIHVCPHLNVQVAAVKAPGFGERKTSYLEDIAILTGAQVIKEELGLALDKVRCRTGSPGFVGSTLGFQV